MRSRELRRQDGTGALGTAQEGGLAAARAGTWESEIRAIVRAFSGAAIFGMPLLFTMEMWWIGMYADVWKLLAFLGLAFLANLGLSYFAGFKQGTAIRDNLNEAVEAMAVGVVASAVVLAVLGRIYPGDPLDSILGKIVIQAVPLSIGASVANAVFGGGKGGRQGGGQQRKHGAWYAVFNDLGATITGGIFVGYTIAPTEEVPMLAAGLDLGHLLALIALTLVLTYMIVFASGFDPQVRQQDRSVPFQGPFSETISAYAVSLVVALVVLYLFDRVELGDPVRFVTEQVLVLGLPTAVGGAAGRLVV